MRSRSGGGRSARCPLAPSRVGRGAYSGVLTQRGNSSASADSSAEEAVATGFSGDPVGGRAGWTVTPVATGGGFLSSVAVACTRGTLCVAAALGYVAVARGQPPLAPVKRSRPTIIGNVVIDHVLLERHCTWGHAPAMFVNRWEDCDRRGGRCRLIPGAGGQRHKVTRSDIGHKTRVQETTLNAGGTGAWATSRPVDGPAKRRLHARPQAVPAAGARDRGSNPRLA
jgi:hypothetical protein